MSRDAGRAVGWRYGIAQVREPARQAAIEKHRAATAKRGWALADPISNTMVTVMTRTPLRARTLGLAFAGLIAVSGAATAQQTQPAAGASSTTSQMQAAVQTMDRNMTAGMQAGSPDQLFAAMMMPHHQGAVDMSRITLRDIKDPELRRMVEKTISDNERSIEELRAWQGKHS